MTKILLTGFEPFGGETINPSFEAIKDITFDDTSLTIFSVEVPVLFDISAQKVLEKIKEINPDIIIMVGQAGGRKSICIERLAINIDDSQTPDNGGFKPLDRTISKFGSPAYFSTLPIKKIEQNIHKAHIPVSISNSAGTYVCNHLMYHVLHELISTDRPHVKAGFIHVPYIPEQTLYKQHQFSLELSIIKKAIEIAIETTLVSIKK
jgi:pyroglutamyl-peptidase